VQTNESSYNEEYLSASVDGMLTPEEQASIDALCVKSPRIQAKLDDLRALKTALHMRRERLIEPTPNDVRTSVLKVLTQEYQRQALQAKAEQSKQHTLAVAAEPVLSHKVIKPIMQQEPVRSLFDVLFGWLPQPKFAYATVFMLAIAGVTNMMWNVVMSHESEVSVRTSKQSLSKNSFQFASFADQSLSNHSAVVAGKITLQKSTSSFEELEIFFRQKGVKYPIIKPKVQATLIGGVVSEHDGVNLAHLVFECTDKSLLYMWQVPEDMMSPAHIYLAYSMMSTFDKGEWMWQSQDKETLAMWEVHEKSKAIVCAMVSDMPQQKMMALFQ
jgi:hypothetical protein